jgi:hypothetical protein
MPDPLVHEGMPRSCPQCGAPLHPGETYCRECGQRVATGATPALPVVEDDHGYPPATGQRRGIGRLLAVLGGLVLVSLLGLVVGRFTAPGPTTRIIAQRVVVTATPLPATATPAPTNTATATAVPTSTPTALPTATPPPTVTPLPPPAPKPKPKPRPLLYQTTWSGGASGWSLPQGWNTIPGELVNDGTTGEPGELTGLAHPPPITPDTANYVVVADIQMVRQNNLSCVYPGFGFGVRAESTGFYLVGMTNDSGSWLGFIVDTSSKSGACSFNRLTASALVKNNVTLDTNWHTYRVEVRANDIKLLVDGNPAVETTDNHHLQSNAVGLWSAAVVLNVRNFKVIAL